MLNEYIIKYAGTEINGSFLYDFSTSEVFFSINVPSEQLKDGPLVTSPEVQLNLQFVQLDIGRMALFYTSKQDARLAQRFAGLPLIRAIEAVCDTPGVDGILIQSNSDAWLAMRKGDLKKILDQKKRNGMTPRNKTHT